MPQADLCFSAQLAFDAADLLARVEATILRHDDQAGSCKGRAYPAKVSHHPSAILKVGMLRKPHRDGAFRAALVADLVALLDDMLPRGTQRSVDLYVLGDDYVTGETP